MKLYKYLIGLLMLFVSSFILADVLYIDINDLVKNAHDIVEGKVTKVQQKWDKDHRFIYTYTTVIIDKSFKNKISADTIVIKEIGGQLDGYTTFAPAQPEYQENENVIIFLQKDAEYFRTFGLNQGKFNVQAINGEIILKRNISVDQLGILEQRIRREDISKHLTLDV